MKITLKKSAIPGRVPLITDLELGELAINTTDGKLFIRQNTNGVDSIIEPGNLIASDGATRIGYNNTTVGAYLDQLSSTTLQSSPIPASNKVPIGSPSGTFSADWLDPNSQLATNRPLLIGNANRLGYRYIMLKTSTARYWKLATLPPSDAAQQDHILIKGVMNDNWVSLGNTPFSIMMGNREGFTYRWNIDGIPVGSMGFRAFVEINGAVSIYLYNEPDLFAATSFSITGVGMFTYEGQTPVSSVTGTMIFDSIDTNTYPPEHYFETDNTKTFLTRVQSLTNNQTKFNSAALIAQSHAGDVHIGMDAHGSSSTSIKHTRGQAGISIVDDDGVTLAPIRSSYITTGSTDPVNYSFLGAVVPKVNGTDPVEICRFGIESAANVNFPGHWSWIASAGNRGSIYKEGFRLSLRAYDSASNSQTSDIFSVGGDGFVYTKLLKAGNLNNTPQHTIYGQYQTEGYLALEVTNSTMHYIGAGSWGNANSASFITTANTTTERSINCDGTVNTAGLNYSNYITKAADCGNVGPGQIVGLTNDGKITDKWANAVTFMIKASRPSFVGGDNWGRELGYSPAEPIRDGEDETTWANIMANYQITKQAWNVAFANARTTVDRIVFAGQDIVNIYNATPGQFVVPVQNGQGIGGMLVDEDNLTLKQYIRAIGQVTSSGVDGRAIVIVKAI